MGRGLTQTDVPLYDSSEYHIPKMFLQFLQHLIMYLCPSVEHGHDKTFDCKVRIYTFLNKSYGLEQLPESFQREEFRLNRDDDRVSGSKGIDRMCLRKATLLRVGNGRRVANVGIIVRMGEELCVAAACEAQLCLRGCGRLWVTLQQKAQV